MGGAQYHPKHFKAVLTSLAHYLKQPQLEDLPLFATGASFAGGFTADLVKRHPEQVIAAVPVIIGNSGALYPERNQRAVPRISIIGEKTDRTCVMS